MSDINLDFTVSNNSIDFTVEPNEITITPTTNQLSIYTSAPGVAGGSNTQLQFNNNNEFGGIPNVTWNGSNLSLGNVANVQITGGINGYVLQTDGTGNLSWTAQTGGGGGNGVPGGANTQIQYNDSGSFGGNVGFTFNEITGNVSIPNNLSAVTLTGNIITASQPNITTVGNLSNLVVNGNALINSTLSINGGIEKTTLDTSAPAANVNFDLIEQAIIYSTANATANTTLNFRGSSGTTVNSYLVNGDSTIGTYVVTTGTTPYGITNIQIDGSAQTIKWINGIAPVSISNSVTAYTFTIIKTASTPTYTVLGSGARYA